MPKLDDRALTPLAARLHQRRHPHRIRHRQPVDIPNRPHTTTSQHRHQPARSSHHHPDQGRTGRRCVRVKAAQSSQRNTTDTTSRPPQPTGPEPAPTAHPEPGQPSIPWASAHLLQQKLEWVEGGAGDVLAEWPAPRLVSDQAAAFFDSASVFGAVTPPARIDHARRARQRCAPCAWPLHRCVSTYGVSTRSVNSIAGG